jgi:squalene-hopene/tetraprenyl-beta-curcumene cyclase
MGQIEEPPMSAEMAAGADAVLAELEHSDRARRFPLRVRRGRSARPNIYDCFPYLFREAFPRANRAALHTLSVAGRLYATALFAGDGLMDGALTGESATEAAAAMAVSHSLAARQLQRLFGPDVAFWEHFDLIVDEYASACVEEKRFAVGTKLWGTLDESKAIQIIRGKDVFPRLLVAGLCELDGDYAAYSSLSEAVAQFFIARQLYDDVVDWKQDLQSNSPSLVLLRLLRGQSPRPDGGWGEVELKSLTRRCFYEGVAQRTLRDALEALSRAESLPSIRCPDWISSVGTVRKYCTSLLQDIDAIVDKNLARVRSPKALRLPVPPRDSHPWTPVMNDSLRYLLQQWAGGFGEVKHTVHFSHHPGVPVSGRYQSGDILQRALVADALIDADEYLTGIAAEVIDEEVRYLLGRRRSAGLGGWSYFPDLPELPPDIVTLSHIMQLLKRRGHDRALQEYCMPVLAAALEDFPNDPGRAISMWVIPSRGRTPEQELQHDWVQSVWGGAPDAAVVANLTSAMLMVDPVRFGSQIESMCGFLLSRQAVDGGWRGDWYASGMYATYANVRALAAIQPALPALERSAGYVLHAQRKDGGWGTGDDSSDSLNTALAILALSALGMERIASDKKRAIDAGLSFLLGQRMPDGCWPSQKLVHFRTRPTTDQSGQTLTYGSKTATTLFVLKAAVRQLYQLPSVRDREQANC